MTKRSEPGERLAWDSAHFGLAIGRALGDDPAEVIAWMRREAIACAYRLVPVERPEVASSFARAGFRLVDLRVTFDADPRASREPEPLAGVTLRPGSSRDAAALEPIAAASYRDARFYRDGRFDEARCDALYGLWLTKSLSGERADHVVVAELDGAPVGFVTCAMPAPDRGSIGLVGVGEPARGRGLGRAMVRCGLGWLADRGAERVTVVTQGRNLGAQRLYQRVGFRTAELGLWLHGWMDELT